MCILLEMLGTNKVSMIAIIISLFCTGFTDSAMATAIQSKLSIVDWRARTTDFGSRSGGANSIAVLVLHHTVTDTAQATLNVLINRKLSVHYIVERNGTVYNMVDDANRAFHAGAGTWGNFRNLNDVSIGIEIVNWGDEPFPAVQEKAVAALSKIVVEKWYILPKNIVSHADFAPARKADVSGFFNYEVFYASLGVFSGLYKTNLPVSEQVKVLLQPSINYNTKVKSLQQQLKAFGYDIQIDGYYGAGTGDVVEAFNRHFCPEIFVKETVVPPRTGQLMRDPKNKRWYGVSQERLNFLLTNS